MNHAGVAEVMLYIDDRASGESLTGDSSNGLVKSFTYSINSEGEPALKLVVYTSSGVFEKYYLTDYKLLDALYTDEEPGSLPLSPGDYVRFSANSKREIKVIEKDFDESSRRLLRHSTGDNVLLRYYYGKVYSKENTSYMLADTNNVADIDSGTATLYNLRVSNNIAIFDSKTKTVSPGSPDDVITYLNSRDLCSTVLVRTRWAAGTNLVIYK